MKLILSCIEKITYIPAEYNVLVAQIIAAVLFLAILYFSARVFTWFCNKYLATIFAKLKADKWVKAMMLNLIWISNVLSSFHYISS